MSNYHRHANGYVAQNGQCMSCNISKSFGGRPKPEPVFVMTANEVAALQAAMVPTPSIEEPQYEGAVVLDRVGNTWVRIAGEEPQYESKPWRRRGFSARDWDHMSPVRILSPGYDPEATS